MGEEPTSPSAEQPSGPLRLPRSVEMSEALMVGAVRQHELVEAAEGLNVQLQTEISERKRAEEALRQSEAALRDFVENASVGLHWVGSDGIILWANQTELDLLGYTREEYVGHHIAEFHADQPLIEGILARLLRGETLHEYEARLRRKDGSIRHVVIRSNALFEADTFIHTRCFTHDITERKQAELTAASLAAIVESSDDAIISKDLNGVISSWNKSAERLFGYTAPEAIGQSITMLIPPDRLHEEAEILERLKRAERVDHFETVRIRKDGSPLHLSVTISPLKDSAGCVIGASKIARDITAQKQAKEFMQSEAKRLEFLVQQRTAKLQAALEELEAFSYSVAHDLRAPLRAMTAYAHVLLKGASNKLSSEEQEYLQRIERAASRLDRLTQEVLTYSQVVRAEIKQAPMDLDRLAHEVVEQYPEISAHCECIEIQSPLLPVLGHEALLTQALANLLINACKFVEPGSCPEVVVRTEAVGQQCVRLWVEDKGIGIAPEHAHRLFKIFGRIHPDKKYEGTGIGLAIVKKAAERMGGTVGFESEPGKGSRFWIQLQRSKPR